MSRMAMRARNAFSLLEIIIATAILAGSAMVLFSLIGLGTKYGNRAEEQTLALTQAQSVLDEYVANLSDEEIQEGVSGVLNGVPAHSYRIEILPFELAGNSGAVATAAPPVQRKRFWFGLRLQFSKEMFRWRGWSRSRCVNSRVLFADRDSTNQQESQAETLGEICDDPRLAETPGTPSGVSGSSVPKQCMETRQT